MAEAESTAEKSGGDSSSVSLTESEAKALRPKIGLGCLVVRKSESEDGSEEVEFLIGERAGSHGAGYFALPGGHLEYAEGFGDCAAREVAEETGLVTNPDDWKFSMMANTLIPHSPRDLHYLTVIVECAYDGPKDAVRTLEPHKCKGWSWIPWSSAKRQFSKEQLFGCLPELIHSDSFRPGFTADVHGSQCCMDKIRPLKKISVDPASSSSKTTTFH